MNTQHLNEEIRYLQLETGTVCNYRCIYCPVAYMPRRGGFMPLDLVEKIVSDLSYFPNIEQIYLNGYDEPTLNPQLVTIVAKLAHLPSKISLLTNGTRLTPTLANRLIDTGARIEFDIHLAAINRKDYQRVHQSKMFEAVMRNIAYLKSFKHLGRVEVHISMLGRDNEMDKRIFQEMQSYFVGIPFKIHKWFPNDRAGLLKNQYNLNIFNKTLSGCSLQNRTKEWIHINANGKVILCCQDYHESYVLGDASNQSLSDIIASQARIMYHQWTVGSTEAPAEYMCRRCLFAISDEKSGSMAES